MNQEVNFQKSVQRFNDFAQEYADRFMNIESYIDSLEKFCSLADNSSPILELACGPGNVTRFLKSKFPSSKILALDLAPAMLEIAQKQVTGVDFRCMDIRHISVLPDNYDAIMCSFGLPFLTQQDTFQLIKDCSAKLNERGIVYFSTMEGDASQAGFEPTSFTGENEIYFNYHKEEDILNALTENHLHVEYQKKQAYLEPDGTTLTDMIFIARRKG